MKRKKFKHSEKSKQIMGKQKLGDKNPMKRKEVCDKIRGKKYPEEMYPNKGMRNKKHTYKAKQKQTNYWNLKTKKEKDEWSKKNSEKAKLGYKSGRIHHNKDKTKENYLPLKIVSKKLEGNNNSVGCKRSEDTRKELSKTRRKLIKEGKINPLKNMHLRPNIPEKTIINLIKKNKLPFNYVGDGKIWFSSNNHSFNPDFLSKNPKHIIEVFGDYWHTLPGCKRKDDERIKTYKKYGYKILVIWEHELTNEINVLNKIKEFIK